MYNEHNHIQEIRSYYNYEYSLLLFRLFKFSTVFHITIFYSVVTYTKIYFFSRGWSVSVRGFTTTISYGCISLCSNNDYKYVFTLLIYCIYIYTIFCIFKWTIKICLRPKRIIKYSEIIIILTIFFSVHIEFYSYWWD